MGTAPRRSRLSLKASPNVQPFLGQHTSAIPFCGSLGAMDNFYGRSVFFVKEAEDALAFYTQKLGFILDWNHQVEGRAFVFQVRLYGFELILNQIEDWTKDRAGRGRVFIGLEESQVAPLREHMSTLV
jgi:hypothetical protein